MGRVWRCKRRERRGRCGWDDQKEEERLRLTRRTPNYTILGHNWEVRSSYCYGTRQESPNYFKRKKKSNKRRHSRKMSRRPTKYFGLHNNLTRKRKLCESWNCLQFHIEKLIQKLEDGVSKRCVKEYKEKLRFLNCTHQYFSQSHR